MQAEYFDPMPCGQNTQRSRQAQPDVSFVFVGRTGRTGPRCDNECMKPLSVIGNTPIRSSLLADLAQPTGLLAPEPLPMTVGPNLLTPDHLEGLVQPPVSKGHLSLSNLQNQH